MTQLLRSVLPIMTAVLMSTGAALAADYDPPIFVDDAPEFVPVEVGNGWYLRGDIGYNFDSNFESYDFLEYPGLSYSEDNTSIFGSIGAGFHFTDYFRMDANVGFLTKQKLDVSYEDAFISDSTTVESEMWSGMVVGYFDLGTFAGLTPYVGAGGGMVYARNKVSDQLVLPNGAVFSSADTDNNFSFAYQLNAGASYQVSKNTSIDLGYQYFSAPDAEYVSTDDPKVKAEGMDFHQIKLGLRYDLW